MKKIYLISLLMLSIYGYAQQDVQFTQYMFNKIYYNPGVAGSGGAVCINGVHRTQWAGFEGAPQTQNLNANIPIAKIHGGLSARVVNDQIGYFRNIEFGLGYAYQMELATGTLGFGLSVNFRNNSLNVDEWLPSDQTIDDPSLPLNIATGLSIDPSFGVYYDSDNIWGGISAINLIEGSADLAGIAGTVSYTNARHYYVMGGYDWEIPGSNWVLMPSTLIKTDLRSSPSVDVNAMGMYNNKFWGGVTYRLQDALAVNVGYQILPSLKLGYSYDIAVGKLSSTTSSGSHEVFLKYCFRIEIPPRQKGSYRNPRFL